MNATPTRETYDALQTAFDWLNGELFAGELPNCMISVRGLPRAYGHFDAGRYIRRPADLDGPPSEVDATDEIALNARLFRRPDREILSTLAHEMAHLWQQHLGKNPPKNAYHNREWAEKMKEIGLQPISASGKETGRQATHSIIDGGAFDRAAQVLLDSGYRIEWAEVATLAKRSTQAKHKYTCPECQQNAWAKQGAQLVCGKCEIEMTPADGAGDDEKGNQAA